MPSVDRALTNKGLYLIMTRGHGQETNSSRRKHPPPGPRRRGSRARRSAIASRCRGTRGTPPVRGRSTRSGRSGRRTRRSGGCRGPAGRPACAPERGLAARGKVPGQALPPRLVEQRLLDDDARLALLHALADHLQPRGRQRPFSPGLKSDVAMERLRQRVSG